MDKSNIVNIFTAHVEQLRNTECSQKEKITCFQQIAECIMSPALMSHINYLNHCSTAVNLLLLFCEDLDSVVRMSSEENLNKIFRSLEKTRVSRILMDLYGEIKRNGNQRSLRICLNLFSYYAPRIKEKNLKGYALRLLACMQVIAHRKETQLSETLCDFVKCFGRYLQAGLTDSETCKLFEVFIGNIGAECAVKRRCSSQNCISLIENARNKSLMAKHGLNQVIDLLLIDQQTHTVLGCLGFLRLLLPLIIRGFPDDCPDDADSHSNGAVSSLLPPECRQIVEIYDYCLHLLTVSNATSGHGLINAALEVINAVLQSLDGVSAADTDNAVAKTLHEMLLGSNQRMQQQRHELLQRRKSLKNQIFQLNDVDDDGEPPWRRNSRTTTMEQDQPDKGLNQGTDAYKFEMQKTRIKQMQGSMGIYKVALTSCTDEDSKQSGRTTTATTSAMLHHHHGHIRHATARSISECVDDDNLLATVVGSVDDETETEANAKAIATNDDGAGAGELEVDDFITFSEINEPQQTTAVAAATATATVAPSIDVDSLLDAMLHDDGDGVGMDGSSSHQLHDSNLLATSMTDDKSQHLSDIDNESFNSIDFEAEITIGGRRDDETSNATASAATVPTIGTAGKTTNNDTIGTFFNNLLTHSNAATESVSKLFRPSSVSKSTPTKSAASQPPDKLDAVSTTTSGSAGDTLSFTSTASSNKRLESDVSEDPPSESMSRKRSDVSSNASNAFDDTFSRSASVTASTAVLADTNTRNTATAADCSSDEEEAAIQTRLPNVNPFLKENSPLKQFQSGQPLLTLKIGSIYEQPLVTYTARLTAARFLLTGQLNELYSDSVIRVSIKSLSLMVIAQCIRLEPNILQLPLEIAPDELKPLQEVELPQKVVDASSPKHSSSGESSSNLSRDYEHLEAQSSDFTDFAKKSPLTPFFPGNDVSDDLLLLEIKDDHFGPSTCDYKTLLNDPLSRSADPVMLGMQNDLAKFSKFESLSTSEIVSSTSTRDRSYRITEAYEDAPPPMQPPRPPKRTKSLRKSVAGVVTPTKPIAATATDQRCKDAAQPLADVLLFYKHTDPILRGGVQLIIGNFVEASGAGLALPMRLDMQHLLALLLKGFEDDIHTVVIQALNAFDKMFPHVIAKYLTEPACHYPCSQQQQQQQQTCKETLRKQHVIAVGPSTSAQSIANDVECPRRLYPSCMPHNDELLHDLLLDNPQIRMPNNVHHSTTIKSENCDGASFFISPKLLLDKLRLCRHNKYWLVQNKYAEVISNLNYIPLGHYYEASADDNPNDADDIVGTYEHLFLDELLHLIGDDDFRVRDHAAICLCRFIITRAQQLNNATTDEIDDHATTTTATANPLSTYQTNFTLLSDFLDYRLFSGMSMHLRQLFCTNGVLTAPWMDGHAGAWSMHSNGTAISGGGYANSIAPPSLLSSTTGSASGSSISTATMAFDGGFQHAHFSSIRGGGACKRQPGHEEKLLSKVLYRLANKLMALHDKNLQFGVISTLKLLLRHFNWMDYQQAWREFNFIEISMKFTYHNVVTASDLSCQNDLIDVTTKLMAGRMLSCGNPSALMQTDLEQLMQHTLKIINIYYHLFTNQRPLFMAKTQKPDLFVNAKELALMQCMGYFGNDYVYIKLYNILRSANDSYKITINQESGSLLLGLLKTCLNTLSVCIELHAHRPAATPAGSPSTSGGGSGSPLDGSFPSSAVLKLIEEILQYLGKLINYAPVECIGCLKQLLKYLFAQNYGNRHQDYYATFIRPYFVARHKGYGHGHGNGWHKPYPANTINFSGAVSPQPPAGSATTPSKLVAMPTTPTTTTSSDQSSRRGQQRTSIVSTESYDDGHRPHGDDSTDDYRLFGELLVSGLQLHTWKSERDSECGRHIKLFEPLVIYCMQLFLKMNAGVQGPILELLSQLLDLNVTYSILDSKNVIFEQIMNNLELIESGNVRNAHLIIPPMMKFLMQLTQKSDRQVITIPKLISVANNLLANSAIGDCAVLALKSLVYELFFALPIGSPVGASSVVVGDAIERRAHFQSPITVSPASTPRVHQHQPTGGAVVSVRSLPPVPLANTVPGAAASAAEDLLAQQRELATQQEVVLGMLEKFIDTGVCQQVLGLLLLRERCNQQMDEAMDASRTNESRQLTMAASSCDTQPQVYSLICRSICEGRYRVTDWADFYALDTFFRNNGRNVLADSKEFLALLQLLITKDVTNFCDLSYATIILANVILKTEEIYLVNHIKLYLRNHSASTMTHLTEYWLNDGPSTSTAAARAAAFTSSCPISEINYFGKVLVEKLLTCLDTLIGLVRGQPRRPSRPLALYCGLTQLFVRSVHDCCCRSRHSDALQSVFRLMLAESEFLDKYYNLIMMHGTPICCWPLAAPTLTSNQAATLAGGMGTLVGLQVEVFRLLSAMKMVTSFTFLLPQPAQQQRTLPYLERRMLTEILRRHWNPINWELQQVQQLFDARFVNILIMEHFEFVCNLCKVDEQFYAVWLDGLLQSMVQRSQPLPKPAVRLILRQFGRLHCDGQTLFKCLQVLNSLYRLEEKTSGQRLQIERLARRLTSQVSNDEEQQRLIGHIRESLIGDGHQNNQLMLTILSEMNNLCGDQMADPQTQRTMHESRIIDEKWLFGQLIKFSTQSHFTDPQQLGRILLEIQSENKLHKIFENATFDGARVLRHAIVSSLEAMLLSFRNNCAQHNPHIHYLQLNPLARVSSAILMARLTDAHNATDGKDNAPQATPSTWPMERLAVSVIALIECVERIERAALIYIDARFVERFLREQLLRPDMVTTLAQFLALCCGRLEGLIGGGSHCVSNGCEEFHALLRCIESLLQQKLVWHELNSANGTFAVSAVVLLMGRLAKQTLTDTIFYSKFKGSMKNAAEDYAVFIAKLIETQIDIATASGHASRTAMQLTEIDCGLLEGSSADNELMERIISIGISVLRTNQYYAYAVTPYEIVQQQKRERLVAGMAYESPTKRQTAAATHGKLPTIPVESLSDVDILRKFVKRLSIFGFTTRQQFEEYFMTFLLLINKVYDEHMVDEQEQYQIKSTCLEAILELLITYKTFPIVGSSNKLSQFHHTTRWARISCDGICLKKLHKVQLLISDMNLFYHPNLERHLTEPSDSVIGTQRFDVNQYDLNFVWQQMEAYAQLTPNLAEAPDKRLTMQVSSESGDDNNKTMGTMGTAIRNYRYFTQQSGVDFKSSSQLIFDVLMQIMEYNHILALPNLVKFCEICESRDQIKCIKDKALRLQEVIPMDDTISHQHLIYLLCKTQAMLIPTLGQLHHLCSLIGNYLKSSHVFIRNATLAGLLCLLECCSKTNTTIGKLSEELSLLRDLIVGYVNRHGIIKESSMQCSDTHTKLVWTLNYCLIEWTSKFVPQCNLLANTIAAASNFLRKTTNEELFLCVLHGLERIVVVTIATGDSGGIGVSPNVWRHKVEKLALELLKLENEKFSIPALKLLVSCMYVGSSKQLENTELSNGVVQDDPEIIAQQTDKVDVLLHCIKSSTREAAWIYGQVLCQIIRDLVPPKEILTKVIKEFVAVNQPHCDVIAMVVHQVFRSAIDSSDLQMLQDWLICTLPTFLGLPERNAVWGLSVIFLSASINLHLIKLFPVVLGSGTGSGAGTGRPSHRTAAPPPPPSSQQPHKLGQHEIALFVTAAQDFHIKLSSAQRMRFQDAFKKFQQKEVYARLLHSLH